MMSLLAGGPVVQLFRRWDRIGTLEVAAMQRMAQDIRLLKKRR
jgi:hypothetical protein